jgi:prepilin-type N-terminal cleavage/methylation domain-containing protein/prepilin-type processing-associated H-X9-DG protein
MKRMKSDHRFAPHGARAFTLVELLVVIGIIALIMAILLPTISKARQSAVKASCASNVRQICAALTAYSNDNKLHLPTYATAGPLGQYNWDIPTAARNQLVKYGLPRVAFYCPANREQNRDIFWTYHSDKEWCVTGYFFYIPRLTWAPSLLNMTYAGPPADVNHDKGQRYFPFIHGERRPAEYELVSDAVISSNGTFNVANEAVGSSTSHVNGNTPQGGNVGFHDGHVTWRPFGLMMKRYGAPQPDHYW